jgi:RNA polymerase sigma-70 factor (ECF subfamily)
MNKFSKLTDEQVVEIVRTNNKEAYAEIIKRYQKKLLRYANYLLGDEHAAADAVQEGFIKSYINLNGFNSRKKFSSWIYRIVHNQALNAVYKNRRQQPLNEAIIIDDKSNIEETLIKKELLMHTQSCLEKMPIIYKEPLSLFYLEEKSYEEISDILRLPLGTVGTRINRAKAIMKKLCQENQK